MTKVDKSIIAALAYFDVFNYPLTQGELYLFLGNKYDNKTFTDALNKLVLNEAVYRFDGFYTLKNDSQIAIRRQQGNNKAAVLITIAGRVAKILIRFPYVRGIAISGSLSKNYADDESDIDLFIITAANRLWIARTLLHLFKKLTFLVHKEHFFCMNYFIDEAQLEIVEKNIYTATEIVTLMPLEGDIVFEKFYSANAWTRVYLPNNIMRLSTANPLKTHFIKRLAEAVFNNKAGNVIDNILRRITAARWQKKTKNKKLNNRGVIMGMNAAKHYAKPDPENYQNKLIQRYEALVLKLLHTGPSSIAHV